MKNYERVCDKIAGPFFFLFYPVVWAGLRGITGEVLSSGICFVGDMVALGLGFSVMANLFLIANNRGEI